MAHPNKTGPVLERQVSFRMTEQDFQTYEKKVRLSGLCKSDFFRDAVITNKTEVINTSPVKEVVVHEHRYSAEDRKQHRQLIATINRVGNNINQLAHKANAAHLAGQLSDELFDRMLYELEIIETFLKRSTWKC